jgi:pyruvate dehydrogenase E1 component
MYGSTDDHPHGEDVFYYLTVYNEPIIQLPEPDGVDVEGILRGMHLVQPADTGPGDERPHLQLLASGVALPWAMKAQRLLAEEWQVRADVWSVTSWNELARDGWRAEEYNLLHPTEEHRTPYVTAKLAEAVGPVLAVSDYMRAVPDQISRWVGSSWHSLGTDGFGFADTRAAARRFFKVDAESIVVGALEALAQRGDVDASRAAEAIAAYRIDDPTAVAHVKQEGAGA